MELLQLREFNVSEVAWKTGFNSHAYFTSCFHEEFGISPSDVNKRNLSDEESENNKEGLTNSIKYFEMAIRADSSFAQDYANLAFLPELCPTW
jgi:AraC-like DNA-binding protein